MDDENRGTPMRTNGNQLRLAHFGDGAWLELHPSAVAVLQAILEDQPETISVLSCWSQNWEAIFFSPFHSSQADVPHRLLMIKGYKRPDHVPSFSSQELNVWLELGAPISHEVEEWSKSRSVILQRNFCRQLSFFFFNRSMGPMFEAELAETS